jgi:hypothetical protein
MREDCQLTAAVWTSSLAQMVMMVDVRPLHYQSPKRRTFSGRYIETTYNGVQTAVSCILIDY